MAALNDSCRIGNITFNRGSILGSGCDGTTVYQGTYGTVPVAVKRVLLRNVSIVQQEIKTVSQASHRNILQYMATEMDNVEYCYIAFELCAGTLSEYVKNELDIGRTADLDILRQATEGLDYLHSLKIIHRDIKPQNILLTFKNAHDEVLVKIADFGFCKPLKDGHSSISMSDVRGTSGWMAPEVIKESHERITVAIDIFALGCVFYFVLSKGNHPFGTGTLRLVHISKGEASLQGIDKAAKNLIQKMIDSDPKNRLCLKLVLSHAFFTKISKDKSPSVVVKVTTPEIAGESQTPTPKRNKSRKFFFSSIRKRLSSGSDNKEIEYIKPFPEGKVRFNIDSVIENGAFGICFFKGDWAGRPVCIKRIPYSDRVKNEFAATNEVRVRNILGFHAHIVVHFNDWKDDKFYFLVVELHEATLQDLAEKRYQHYSIDPVRLLREAVQGIAYIHSRGFLYMKLEPKSFRLILGPQNNIVVKLSNFESCIEIGPSGAAQNFVSQNFDADLDWLAPEIVADDKRPITDKADVFSMGCIFYYVLSGRKHLSGGRRTYTSLGYNSFLITTPFATNLVKQMVDPRPVRRPNCQQILNSPLFTTMKRASPMRMLSVTSD